MGGLLHGAGADGHRGGAALSLVDVGLYLGVGQRVGLARRAGGGREDDTDHTAVQVDERPARIPRLDLRLDDPDTAHHQSLTIDVATFSLDLAVDDGGRDLLPTAARALAMSDASVLGSDAAWPGAVLMSSAPRAASTRRLSELDDGMRHLLPARFGRFYDSLALESPPARKAVSRKSS